MNKIYRLVWNAARNAWVVVAEGTRARGKGTALARTTVAAAMMVALGARPALAQVLSPTALPTAGRVVAGQATIATEGATTSVTQGSDKAILYWGTFNIGSAATVRFQQPGSGSVVLNRVEGPDPSQIFGRLTANGSVFLINPNGVLFGAGAQVDVGGLVASTLDIRDTDFLAGRLRFERGGAIGSVVNEGDIAARYVALLAPEVRNDGVIVARQGVALAGGDAVTLGLSAAGLVDVQVDRATIDTLIRNRRLIQVDGGTVILSAQSARGLVGRVVNTGTIDASGISTEGGVVRLVASSGIDHAGTIRADAGTAGRGGEVTLIADLGNPDSRTTVSGSISARGGSEGGDGGFVDTSASRVSVADSARVDTRAPNGRAGHWLIDPADYTVAASGGDITGATLTANLGTGNVTIDTASGTSGANGDVFVNDGVGWSANTLTIRAHRDVNVNAPLDVTATGGLAVEYGQGAVEAGNGAYFTVNAPVNMASTASLSTRLGSDGVTKAYTIVNDVAGLTGIDANATTLTGNYALGSNVVLSGTWTPIGNTSGPFDGIFEGLGHTVSGATNTGGTSNVGFFGQTGNSGRVQNFGVTNVNFAGVEAVGGLAGLNSGTLYNTWSTGTVGVKAGTDVSSQVRQIGGLAGQSNGYILRSYSSVDVTATVGDQSAGTGMGGGIGGLAGAIVGGKVSDSYATGSVSGLNDVGGLVGHMAAPVERSYSRGLVTAAAKNDTTGNSGATNVGGLIGSVAAPMDPMLPSIPVTDSFWDTQTSGQATSGGAETGLTTAQMQTAATFSAWDTTRVWKLADGSYPTFVAGAVAAGPSAIAISLNDSTRVYGDTSQPLLTGFSYTGSLKAGDALSGAGWGTALTDYLGVGTYAYSTANLIAPTFSFAGGHTSADYTVSYSNNSLTVTPRPITVTASAGQGKVYNGQAGADPALTYAVATPSPISPGSPLVNGDTLSGALGRAAGNNVGSYAIGQGTLANPNYAITFAGDNFTVTPKTLTVTGTTAVGKTYDGSTAAAITVGTLGGLVGSETVGATATGTFDGKDAGAHTATAAYTLADGGNGGLASNYSLAGTSGHAATITPKALTVTGTTAAGKTYDSTAAAAITIGTLSGFVGSETVGATATGTFDSKNAGARTATAAYTLADGGNGGLASNYSLADTTHAATITPKALTVTGTTAAGRTYDGSTAAAITIGTLSGFVGSETVGATATGTFDSKNAGARTATAAYTLADGGNGGLASNYTLAGTSGHAATISPKVLSLLDLTFTGTQVNAKPTVVAGDQAVLASGSVPAGVKVAGDDLAVAFGSGAAADRTITAQSATSVGSGAFQVTGPKPAAAITLTGTDASNYTLTGSSVSARVQASAAPATSSTSNTIAQVVNRASEPTPTTVADFERPATTTTTAPPPDQVSATTSNPTPRPGDTVKVATPVLRGGPFTPEAAVLVPADGDDADIPMPTPVMQVAANGTVTFSVTIPPATPPGVYIVAIVVKDASGATRAVIVPVVVRRKAAA